jgi:hypothetical protein
MTQAAKVAEAVSGRATGVLFFAGFGAIWMINGLAAMHRLNPISLAAIAMIAAALAIPAIRLLRIAASSASRNPPAPAEIECQAEIKRAFWRVNTAQWIAILAAIVVLNLAQKVEYLAPVITFIIGMHFFPLATLFRYRAHNLTGTLLVLWAIANTATLPPQLLPSIGALGTATILLASAAHTIYSAARAARTITAAGLRTQTV